MGKGSLEMGKIGRFFSVLCALFGVFVSSATTPLSAAGAAVPGAPALDPPRVAVQGPASSRRTTLARDAVAATEWTLHKTPDGSHPDGNEQQMVWLMNRARANPAQEGLWLATSDLSDVAGGRDYYEVDLAVLQAEFGQIAVKPPAAFDVRLYTAAEVHCQSMIERNSQDHDGQFAAIEDNGFSFLAARGNVFFYAYSALNAHAAFNIDWGRSDDTGMQPGRGHRLAIMAMDGDYTNVGLAVVAKPNGTPYEGYYAVTGNYCQADTGSADHFNRFLVGTVWEDLNRNEMYDPGEGLADVSVVPDQGTYYAVTAAGGGYALPIMAAGTYEITFSGAALGAGYTRPATFDARSVLLDLCVSDDSSTDDPADPDPDDPADPDPEDPADPDPDDPDDPDDPQQELSQEAGTGGGAGCFIGSL